MFLIMPRLPILGWQKQLAMGLFNLFKKKSSPLNDGTPDAVAKKVNVTEVTTQLEQLGFFQYVAQKILSM